MRSSTNKESMISTINNNHSIHYNNSKQNKNNIHKSDDKNKIKEKEEKKSNAEIKKNNSQRRIVKNSDENKENKNTENIKKDYKKKKDLVFITFETHEDALLAIQRFEDEKRNNTKLKDLKKIFLLSDNENINMIQVSLAFSQEAMQNKKKIKDNRKKVPSQISKGNSTNNINDNNINYNQPFFISKINNFFFQRRIFRS